MNSAIKIRVFSSLLILHSSFASGAREKLWYYKDPEHFRRALPRVFMLNLPEKFSPRVGNKDLARGHGHDSHFIAWLTNGSYGPLLVNSSVDADLYFLPVHQPADWHPEESWFFELDLEISKIAEKIVPATFALDRVFVAATCPLAVRQTIKAQLRNVDDIRMLRVDNDLTTNGRDIFVPYVVQRNIWNSSIALPKKYFMVAACREAGGFLDSIRAWRTKLFHQWQFVPHSIISNNLPAAEFDKAFRSSDFCLIIPGDTSSTAKLYMAIFTGCVPVVFLSYKGQLPFSAFIDWSIFSILVLKDVINNKPAMKELLQHLHQIRRNPHHMTRLRRYLNTAADLFDWTQNEWPSPFHLVLLELFKDYPRQVRRGIGKLNDTMHLDPYLL